MDLKDNFHEITTSNGPSDVRHVKPHDRTAHHVWFWEAPTATGVLTRDGVTQIAFHQYRAGTYTFLDNLLNPLWARLTECLPLSMAPNLVTTIGALHCLVAYILTWQYTPQLSQPVPVWLLLVNAYCMIAYYTLDCMDGKQARRTNSSSPLGQLFDHGVDCICNLSHISMVQSWLCVGGTVWLPFNQGVLQFSFFVAQWEEYYTETLPHATGDFGVTEVNYGMAILTLLNAAFQAVDREALYAMPFVDVVPIRLLQLWQDSSVNASVRSVTVPLLKVLPTALADALGGVLQIRHVLMLAFGAAMFVLILLSVSRVVSHASMSNTQQRLSAISKLVTPALLVMAPLGLLPASVWSTETRYVSLVAGLALCLVTIKLIVFSMGKQAYAMIQWDALPAIAVMAWIGADSRFTAHGVHSILVVTTIYYLVRIYQWTASAIGQICQRLDIFLFTIKSKDSSGKSKSKQS
jgi:ethanolaminephosphotransferase